MLKEHRKVKQEAGPGRRRWFEDDTVELDLILWIDRDEAIEGFQICYNLGGGEHALTWRPATGFVHNLVDEGSAGPFSNQTPILVADGQVPWAELQRFFGDRSDSLEAPVRALVMGKLLAGPGETGRVSPGQS